MLTVLIHINRIRPRSLCLLINIDLSRPQPLHILRRRARLTTKPRQPQLLRLLGLGIIQQLLIPLQTLRRGSSDDRCNRSPLRGHQFRQMQQLFVFRFGPFDLFDRGVEPFVPSGFALLRGFPDQERRDTSPLL